MTATIGGGYAAFSLTAWAGGAAVGFGVLADIEVQVTPGRMTVHLNRYSGLSGKRAVWDGADAAAMGMAVAAGICPVGVLADWLEEHEPTTADRGFAAAGWVRQTDEYAA